MSQKFINKYYELEKDHNESQGDLFNRTILALEADGITLRSAKSESLHRNPDLLEKAGPGGRGSLLHNQVSETILEQKLAAEQQQNESNTNSDKSNTS